VPGWPGDKCNDAVMQPVGCSSAGCGGNQGNKPGTIEEVLANSRPAGTKHQHGLTGLPLTVDERESEQGRYRQFHQAANRGHDFRHTQDCLKWDGNRGITLIVNGQLEPITQGRSNPRVKFNCLLIPDDRLPNRKPTGNGEVGTPADLGM